MVSFGDFFLGGIVVGMGLNMLMGFCYVVVEELSWVVGIKVCFVDNFFVVMVGYDVFV